MKKLLQLLFGVSPVIAFCFFAFTPQASACESGTTCNATRFPSTDVYTTTVDVTLDFTGYEGWIGTCNTLSLSFLDMNKNPVEVFGNTKEINDQNTATHTFNVSSAYSGGIKAILAYYSNQEGSTTCLGGQVVLASENWQDDPTSKIFTFGSEPIAPTPSMNDKGLETIESTASQFSSFVVLMLPVLFGFLVVACLVLYALKKLLGLFKKG
jgi:hypothetical protein